MADPIFEPLVLVCPECARLHIDEGERSTTPHTEHECFHCAHRWSPREHATVGIPLGTLSDAWLFDVAVVHGPAAEDAIRQAWAHREHRQPRLRAPATTYGGRS